MLILGVYIQSWKKEIIKLVLSIVECWMFEAKENKSLNKEHKVLAFGYWNSLMSRKQSDWLKLVGLQRVVIGITRSAPNKEMDYWITNLDAKDKALVISKNSHSDHIICEVVVEARLEGRIHGATRFKWNKTKLCYVMLSVKLIILLFDEPS